MKKRPNHSFLNVDQSSIAESVPLEVKCHDTKSSICSGGEINIPDAINNLSKCLLQMVELYPDRGITFIDHSKTSTLTYRDLLNNARTILFKLQHSGVSPGDKVILFVSANKDIIASTWACFLGGYIAIPIGTPTKFSNKEQVFSKLKSACQYEQEPWIITDKLTLAIARKQLSSVCDEDRFIPFESLRKGSNLAAIPVLKRDQIALLLFTSGSTSQPKGVPLTHINIISYAFSSGKICDISPEDVFLNWMPFDHVGGIVMLHIRGLCMGCRQIQIATDLIISKPYLWIRYLDQYKATISWAPNFAFAQVLNELNKLDKYQLDLSHVRQLYNGGETVIVSDIAKFLKGLQNHGLRPTSIVPAYGMSETSSGITYLLEENLREGTSDYIQAIGQRIFGKKANFLAPTDDQANLIISVGKPIPGLSIRITDDHGSVLPSETIGHLQVKGPMIMTGYYEYDEAHSSFTTDGWFSTGDIGFIKNDALTLTGRDKDIIIVNGNNLPCIEIEQCVEKIQGVSSNNCIAVGISNYTSGSENVLIFFCLQDETQFKNDFLQKIISQIKTQLIQTFGIRIASIIPVKQNEIPKSNIGKKLRNNLLTKFESGHFNEFVQRLQSDTKPKPIHLPENQLQHEVLGIWQEAIDNKKFGVDDNFFELGGHSLSAIRIVANTSDKLNVNIELSSIFKSPTVREFCKVITRFEPSTSAQITKSHEHKNHPLSFAQRRLWLINQISPQAKHVYNLPIAYEIHGSLDIPAFRLAWNALIERHEALRTNFELVANEPVQQINEGHDLLVDLEIVDLNPNENILDRLQVLTNQPFDLEQGPLVRVVLYKAGKNQYFFTSIIHHIVVDGWSMELLLAELKTLYIHFTQNHQSTLQQPDLAYHDFARWQINQNTEQLATSWKKRLMDFNTPLSLPYDYPSPTEPKGLGALHKFQLKSSTYHELRKLAQSHHTSLSNLILSVFALMLHRVTDQKKIPIGVANANRERPELQSTVGFFVNILPIQITFSKDLELSDLISSTSNQVIDSISDAEFPYEKMIELVKPGRTDSTQSLVNVIYAYQNFRESRQFSNHTTIENGHLLLDLGPNLKIKGLNHKTNTTKFDITLFVYPFSDCLDMAIEYSTERFSPKRIADMSQLLCELLKIITESAKN